MKPQIRFFALITLLATVLTPLPLNWTGSFSTLQVLAQPPDARKAQADQLLEQGIKQYETGRVEASRQACQKALTIYQEIKDRLGEVQSLINLTKAYFRLGNNGKATEYSQQSLALAREIKDRRGEGRSLYNLGDVYYASGNYNKAIKYYQQSLVIAQEVKDRWGEGSSLQRIGIAYEDLGNYTKAIDFYQQSLKISQESGDIRGEGYSLLSLGDTYKKLNHRRKAINYYLQSLTITRKVKDLELEREVLIQLVVTYNSIRKYTEAIEYEKQVLKVAQSLSDRVMEGRALISLGWNHEQLKNYNQAIDFYQQSLKVAQVISNRQMQAQVLFNLGSIYSDIGNYSKAIEYFQPYLAVARTIHNHKYEMCALCNLGYAYLYLGNNAKVIEYAKQYLVIARSTKDAEGEICALLHLGYAYENLGDYAKMVEYGKQSLASSREIKYFQGEADSLKNLGVAYEHLGDSTKASEYHEQALTIYRKIHDHYGETIALASLGYLQDSLARARKFKNRDGEATALNGLGLAYAQQSNYAKAIEYFEKSIAVYRKIHHRLGEGAALGNLGNTYQELGNFAKAINYQQQSLAIKREVHNRLGEGIMLSSIGATFFKSGNITAAEKYLTQSIQIWESIRSLLGSNDAYKVSIFESQAHTYLTLQEVLIAENKAKAALELAERGRARAFVELLASRLSPPVTAAQSSITPPTAKLLQQIAKSHNSTLVEYSIMYGGSKVQGREHWGESELFIWVIKPTGEAAFRRVDLESLWRQQNTSLKDLASNSPSVLPAVSNSPDAVNTAPQVEQELTMPWEHPDVIVFIIVIGSSVIVMAVYYGRFILTKKAAQREIAKADNARGVIPLIPTSWYKLKPHWLVPSLWLLLAVGSTGSLIFGIIQSQPIAQNSNQRITQRITQNRHLRNDSLLAQLISSTHESIGTNRGLGIVPKGQKTSSGERLKQLHQILIQPIADLLPTDPNAHIIFIPHKSLFLVPFPALQDADGKSLIEKHTILTAPSIQALNLTHQERQRVRAIYKLPLQGKDALIVGNPTMPRVPPEVGEPPQQLPNLPGAEEEAKSIAALLKTQAITGNEATKQAILQKMSGARIVHLATHGILDEMQGLGSAIALAPNPYYQKKVGEVNGLLTAEEILNLKLNAELVVLSACDTGRGRITGDSVVGLSRSLISAGVPSVIVSLWSVPDAPTAFLMTEFYRNLQKNPDKAQALRQAMLTTMKQHPNPIDWAAFTLIGEAE